MTPKKHIGWVNIYECRGTRTTGAVHKSEEEAKNHILNSYVKTVKIEWEE